MHPNIEFFRFKATIFVLLLKYEDGSMTVNKGAPSERFTRAHALVYVRHDKDLISRSLNFRARKDFRLRFSQSPSTVLNSLTNEMSLTWLQQI